MTEDELRRIGADDWTAFKEVRLRALADAPDAFGAVLADARQQPDSLWRDRAAGPGPALVGFAGGIPVAMGGLFTPADRDAVYVWGMWTAPEVRGRGWAGRILDDLLARARETGRDVVLHVTEGNDAARRLYVGRGFQSTGTWEPLREGSPLRIEELRLRLT